MEDVHRVLSTGRFQVYSATTTTARVACEHADASRRATTYAAISERIEGGTNAARWFTLDSCSQLS